MDARVHPWFRPESLVGATLRGYPLEGLLGFGGFGAVYRTRSPQGEPRAIKVLYPPHSLAQDDMRDWDAYVTHFLREAQAAIRFTHPNIIRVYDSGQTHWRFTAPSQGQGAASSRSDEYPLVFYVADFIPDGVDRRLRDGRLFAPQEAARIAAQVCDALIALHGATPPILHRDLNPGNIRLAEGGRAVLTDFGVARIEGVPTTYVTGEGPPIHRGVGAPEQFAWEEPDERTDIYQCGALLLAMLTGKYPRQGDPQALLDRKGVPQDLAQPILRCLEADRAKRFLDAAALKAALLGNTTAPTPDRQTGLRARSLVKAWQHRLASPSWSSRRTPVVEEDGCYLWDSQTVYRVNPEDGTNAWTWKASGPIRDSYQSPALQLGGRRLYVRHGAFLSCLDIRGAEQWRGMYRREATGAFQVVRDFIIVDGYDGGRDAPHGLAALDGQTGQAVWTHREDEYHVDYLAGTNETLFVVESIGLAASGGLRIRCLNLASGEALGVHDLADQKQEMGTLFGRSPLLRCLPPVVTPDGAIVVGLCALTQPRPYLMCFDRGLNLRWTRFLELGGAQLRGDAYLTAAQGRLLVCMVARDDAGNLNEGWVAGIDLQTGERMWQRKCPENAVVASPAAAPDEPLVFALAHRAGKPSIGGHEWRLVAIDPSSGEELWQGPERKSPRGALPLGPVVTPTRVYLQAPLEPVRDRGGLAGGVGRGVIEAFQRR